MARAWPAKSPDSLLKLFSRKTRRFYNDYSKFVLRELTKAKVRIFVGSVIEEQEIEPSKVKAIKIMVYPFGASKDEIAYAKHEKINVTRSQYFGHYIPWLRRIDIYPPRLPPAITEDMTARQIWDDKDMRYYFFCFEPVDTLVHEYLHVKYKGERTVERLSKRYMINFEKETTGSIKYSRKKMPFFVWLELFVMAYENQVF